MFNWENAFVSFGGDVTSQEQGVMTQSQGDVTVTSQSQSHGATSQPHAVVTIMSQELLALERLLSVSPLTLGLVSAGTRNILTIGVCASI